MGVDRPHLSNSDRALALLINSTGKVISCHNNTSGMVLVCVTAKTCCSRNHERDGANYVHECFFVS